jgi:hypothetical protein
MDGWMDGNRGSEEPWKVAPGTCSGSSTALHPMWLSPWQTRRAPDSQTSNFSRVSDPSSNFLRRVTHTLEGVPLDLSYGTTGPR